MVMSIIGFSMPVNAQPPQTVIQNVQAKLKKVKNYVATGRMKTNVIFIKAPIAKVKVYYKSPNLLQIKNESGISFIPKGAININLNSIFVDPDGFDLIDMGKDASTSWRVIKLLPKDENANIVLSTLYIDTKNWLIQKATTTTKENGTYELRMTYGKYADWGLADKVVFRFNTENYKLPKGITFDYDDGSDNKTNSQLKKKKGELIINYSSYVINKGLPDTVFQ
ncbi:MAG: hypothetical protein R2796_00670 [Chitinophagaceae bacterium]|nr:hypothetical protein [Chitinophagaceae bacterium]HQV05579.1 hypothetical protein [Chitinophagaceae bacterium]